MTDGIERDRYDRPLIIPPGGGVPVPYQRTSNYAEVLEDTYNLRKWEQRHVAFGVIDRPDLALQIVAHKDDKGAVNRFCDQAKDYAGTTRSSNTGTALHKVTERIDLGEEVPVLPDPYQADIEAYREATQMLEPAFIEKFIVNDWIGAAGTTDRLYHVGDRSLLTVGDTKTGRGLEYGIVKIAVQLAIYSRSVGYDPKTGERTDLGIDPDWGLIVHLPAGTGSCQPIWINLDMGWSLALLARDIRDSRKLKFKDLTVPAQFEDFI